MQICKAMFHLEFEHFFTEVYKYCCHEKWAWGIRSTAPATRHHSSCTKSKMMTVYDSFTKQDFRIYKASSKFTKYCARNSKWPSKPPPISTPANVLARCRKCHTCHSDEKRRKSSLSGKTTLQTSKCPGNPTPATKTRIFPKTDAACRQEGTSARELCKKMDYRGTFVLWSPN